MITYDFLERRAYNRRSVRRSVLAICGGGNAGHALAVVGSQNFSGDVVWLTSSEEKAELLRRGVFSEHGLRSTGVITGRADKIRVISSDPAEVIPHADVVMIVVPAFAHAAVLSQINPFLKETALVGALPARSGFEFDATHLVTQIQPQGRRVIFGLQTLPWSTRVQQPGMVVNFGALKARVLMATLPAQHAPAVASRLTQILGMEIVPTKNFLNMTLGNPGQVIHPGLMYGFFRAWNGEKYNEDTIPLFYAHATDEIGRFVESLSSDISAVAQKVQMASAGALDLSGVLAIHDWLKISYPTQTKDSSTVATCFRTGPLQARKAPMCEVEGGFVPNFRYRYLSEDVPFGLAITKSIAQIAGVATPAIDTVLSWAQLKLDKRYLVAGRLGGSDTHPLPIPQNSCIDTCVDLVEWYRTGRTQAVSAQLTRAL